MMSEQYVKWHEKYYFQSWEEGYYLLRVKSGWILLFILFMTILLLEIASLSYFVGLHTSTKATTSTITFSIGW